LHAGVVNLGSAGAIGLAFWSLSYGLDWNPTFWIGVAIGIGAGWAGEAVSQIVWDKLFYGQE